jgi:hypothetical protein
MSAVSDAITAYDVLTAQLFTDLDAIHVDQVGLQALKGSIQALGKESSEAIEGGVAISLVDVPTLHGYILTLRDVCIGISDSCRDGTGADELKAHDWEAEFVAGEALIRE